MHIRDYQLWYRNQQRAFDRQHSDYLIAFAAWNKTRTGRAPKEPRMPDMSYEAFMEQAGFERLTDH